MADIRVRVQAKSLGELAIDLENQSPEFQKRIWVALGKVGRSTSARIKRNVSGKQPFGTGPAGSPPIVRRLGRVYDTIGYRRSRKDGQASLVVGAIKGSNKGRKLAAVHDGGATIEATGGKKLVIPAPDSGLAISRVTGRQYLTLASAKERYYSWYINKAKTVYLFRRHKGSKPEVGFLLKESVKIPARRIISREVEWAQNKFNEEMQSALSDSFSFEKRVYKR